MHKIMIKMHTNATYLMLKFKKKI